MALSNQAHEIIRNPKMRQKVTTLAMKKGISFNEAMKEYITDK